MDKFKLLVIDDLEENIFILDRKLSENFSVDGHDGRDIILYVKKHLPDLLLINEKLDVTSGYDLCRMIKEDPALNILPILIYSDEHVDETHAMVVGANDILSLSSSVKLMTTRIHTQLVAANFNTLTKDVYMKKEEELLKRQEALIQVIGKLIEFRDYNLDEHVFRVGRFVYHVARALGIDEEEATMMKHASYFHDIGKIALTDDILLKEGQLTYSEWITMSQHALASVDFLESDDPLIKLASKVAIEHHEKYNGQGYPNQLKGEEISLVARIVAVCDVFDAMTHDRCYRQALSFAEAIDFLRDESNEAFDPKIVDIFVDNIGKMIDIKNNV